MPAIAQGLCVPFAPQVSTRCFPTSCTYTSTYQICFTAWAPGAGPLQGTINIVSSTAGGELARFTSTAELGPGVFRLTRFAGSDTADCGVGTPGMPLLTVNETCGPGQAATSKLFIQVRRECSHSLSVTLRPTQNVSVTMEA